MNAFPEILYRAEQVRELDRIAIEDYGTPGVELMERAGKAAFEVLRAEWPRLNSMVVLCGIGNNAGDGYVIARLGLQAGMQVLVLSLGNCDRLRGDALSMAEEYLSLPGKREAYDASDLKQYPVIVDAMLGTGTQGDVAGDWADAIVAINLAQAAGSYVLAVDLPSGLHADTGHVSNVAVQANVTTTFIGVKQGLLTADGPQHCGTLYFDDLGVEKEVYQHVIADVRLFNDATLKQHLSPRAKNTHKGHFGKLLVVGGNAPYFGAVSLAATAALRSGAGIVAVATRQQNSILMNLHSPELISYAVETRTELISLLSQFDAVVIGPGLGSDQWAEDMLAVTLESRLPLVIDADGLNGLARVPLQNPNWLLTPHPGEAAQLLGCSSAEIQINRFAAVAKIQQQYQATVVLKGCGTLLKTKENGIDLCQRGNPGMASAGMGDVLAGLLGGLIVQGFDIDTAAKMGVYIHACAGDLSAAEHGERGLLASDLYPYIRRLVNPLL